VTTTKLGANIFRKAIFLCSSEHFPCITFHRYISILGIAKEQKLKRKEVRARASIPHLSLTGPPFVSQAVVSSEKSEDSDAHYIAR